MHADFAAVFFVPVVIFLTIVAPVWLVLHYRSKNRAQAGLSDDDRHSVESLSVRARQMSERIEALEAILDAQVLGWRERAP